MSILCICIPRELRDVMERYSEVVDWREEVLKFIEEKVKALEKLSTLKEVEKVLNELPPTPRGFSIKCLGEDRGSN